MELLTNVPPRTGNPRAFSPCVLAIERLSQKTSAAEFMPVTTRPWLRHPQPSARDSLSALALSGGKHLSFIAGCMARSSSYIRTTFR